MLSLGNDRKHQAKNQKRTESHPVSPRHRRVYSKRVFLSAKESDPHRIGGTKSGVGRSCPPCRRSLAKSNRNYHKKGKLKSQEVLLLGFLVGMTGFEPATSCSQSRRATICATSRKILNFASVETSRRASGCCHQNGALRSLFGQRPSFFLASSATGGARKRPHLRYIPKY